jgi:hypothetical protein
MKICLLIEGNKTQLMVEGIGPPLIVGGDIEKKIQNQFSQVFLRTELLHSNRVITWLLHFRMMYKTIS